MLEVLVAVSCMGDAKAFISGHGLPSRKVIDAMHSRNVLIGARISKVQHAISAVVAGVDFVIVHGAEGSARIGDVPWSTLLPEVVDVVGGRVPVVASYELHNCRELAVALAYGADGVWLGTRLLQGAPRAYKQAYQKGQVPRLMPTREPASHVVRMITEEAMAAHNSKL